VDKRTHLAISNFAHWQPGTKPLNTWHWKVHLPSIGFGHKYINNFRVFRSTKSLTFSIIRDCHWDLHRIELISENASAPGVRSAFPWTSPAAYTPGTVVFWNSSTFMFPRLSNSTPWQKKTHASHFLHATITGSSFAAGCLRNLLPGSAPVSLQWFELVLIIQQ